MHIPFRRRCVSAVPVLCFCLINTCAPAQQAEAKLDPVKAGAVLFANSGCQFCHGPAGAGTERAPSLRDIRKRKDDEAIRHQIHDGGGMMPPFGEALTDEEIAHLSEFLRAKDAWKLLPLSGSVAPPTASR